MYSKIMFIYLGVFVNIIFYGFIPVEMGVMPEIAQAVEEMDWL